jgi:serine/threonine protein kinase
MASDWEGVVRPPPATGLVRWQAPEAIRGAPVTFASDVYAFGMVLWSLFSTSGGAVPHRSVLTDGAYAELVMRCGAVPAAEASALGLQHHMEPRFQAIFSLCLKQSPGERPEMTNVAALLLDLVEGQDRWEVERGALVTIQKLGEGQFGDVVKMATSLFSDDGSMDFVAVKMLRGSNSSPAAARAEAEFVAEIELMKRLRHPNLVALLGVCTRAPPFWAVLELLHGGSLDEWLPSNGPALLNPAPTRLVVMLNQVALGCLALSQAGIIHRDLAARNILVDSKLQVKVADYGLSRDVDEDRNYYRLTTERPLPVRWTAPEAVVTLTWTSASDCYSYGVVVFEMFTFGAFPFALIDSDGSFIELLASKEPLHTVLLAQIKAELAKHGVLVVPPIVVELTTMCLARDPHSRPTFAELARLTARSAGATPMTQVTQVTQVTAALLPPLTHRDRALSKIIPQPRADELV